MNLYNPDGIFLGGNSLEQRNAYIDQKVKEYDQRHPGNRLGMHRKRKYARAKWQRFVTKQLQRDRKMFAELVA